MNEPPRNTSWWHTMPGMLTALAGVITAVAGLVVALNQAGLLGGDAGPSPAPVALDSSTAPATGADAAAPAGGRPTTPALQPLPRQVAAGDAVFEVLDVRTQPRNPESYAVRIQLRFTNESAYPANFWDAGFRLLVDGVPRAPTGGLNEVVEGRSAVDGEISFIVPVAARSLVLRVRHAGEDADVTLNPGASAAKP